RRPRCCSCCPQAASGPRIRGSGGGRPAYGSRATCPAFPPSWRALGRSGKRAAPPAGGGAGPISDGDGGASSPCPPFWPLVTPVPFGVTSPVCTSEQKVPTETFLDVHCVPTVQRGVVRVTTGLTPHPSDSPG